MIELGNHHLVTIIVIINSVKNYQWIVIGKSLMRKEIYIVSKYIPTKCLLITKGKMNSFIVEKPDRHPLYQMIKVNSSIMEQIKNLVPPNRMQ